jgi:hypothetical protein
MTRIFTISWCYYGDQVRKDVERGVDCFKLCACYMAQPLHPLLFFIAQHYVKDIMKLLIKIYRIFLSPAKTLIGPNVSFGALF